MEPEEKKDDMPVVEGEETPAEVKPEGEETPEAPVEETPAV